MEKPGYWAVIPACVRYDADLPANAKLLYGEITALSDAKGYCFASNAYFTELFGLSDRSVTRLIAKLADRGYLRVEVIRGEKNEVLERRIYAVYNSTQPCDPPDKNVGTPPDKNVTTPPDKNVGENNTSIEYITPIVPLEGDEPQKQKRRKRETKEAPDWKPERFAKFWAFYPRGENKQGAIRAWDKLRPDDGLIARMGLALQRQKQKPDWAQGVGIPYASTWLNGRRWEDEDRRPIDVQPAQTSKPLRYHVELIDGEEVVIFDEE